MTKSFIAMTIMMGVNMGTFGAVAHAAPGGKVYSVGGRPQRIRFHLASHGQSFDQMQQILGPDASASITKLITDPAQTMPNQPQGKFLRQGTQPSGAGLVPFAEGNDSFVGMIINPGLVMCLANTLNVVKQVIDDDPALFGGRPIDEVNLFARAVPEPTGKDTLRVGFGPAATGGSGSALNVLVEYEPLTLECALPTAEEFLDHIEHAEQL
jgi:hypothetical protein